MATGDPLIRLPYELWCECISFAIADAVEGPLPLMAVSSEWRGAILDTPSLWTTVIINHDEDEEARIHTFLFLSKGQPIDVIAQVPTKYQETLKMITTESRRIRSFTVSINRTRSFTQEGISRQANKLLAALSQGGLYPEIRLIGVEEGISPVLPKTLLQMCPNLRVVQNLPVDTPSFLGGHIRSLYCRNVTPSIATQIYRNTSLLSLHLAYQDSQPLDAWSEHFRQLAANPVGQLRELTIELAYDQIDIVSRLLVAFPELHSLELRFTLVGKDPSFKVRSFDPANLRKLRNLTLDFPIILTHTKGPEMFCDKILLHFMALDALINLEALSFYCSDTLCDISHFYGLLKSASNIRVLAIQFGPNPAWHIKSQSQTSHITNIPQMDGLDDLTLTPSFLINYLVTPNATRISLESWDSLSSIKAPNLGPGVLRLMIPSSDLDSINRNLLPEDVARRWNALHSIQLSSLSACKSLLYISSIRIVQFSKAPLARGYQAGLNAFLLDLLRNPNACPNLETVKSDTYPRWDLLFQVLSRRNSSQISHVKHIVVPSYPSFSILSLLVLLLRSRPSVTTIPRFDDSISQRLRDSNEYWCTYCIVSGHFDCLYGSPRAPLSKMYSWTISQRTEAEFDAIDNANLDPWERGTEELRSLIQIREVEGSKEKCSIHSGAVEISGYTLDGVPRSAHI